MSRVRVRNVADSDYEGEYRPTNVTKNENRSNSSNPGRDTD